MNSPAEQEVDDEAAAGKREPAATLRPTLAPE